MLKIKFIVLESQNLKIDTLFKSFRPTSWFYMWDKKVSLSFWFSLFGVGQVASLLLVYLFYRFAAFT